MIPTKSYGKSLLNIHMMSTVLTNNRYLRTSDTDHLHEPEPLWVSSTGQPTHIPLCPNCGGKRTLEFQVLPQLLSYLNIDHMDVHSFDFGSLYIYTCAHSCDLKVVRHVDTAVDPDPFYQEEYLWVQHFSQENCVGNS